MFNYQGWLRIAGHWDEALEDAFDTTRAVEHVRSRFQAMEKADPQFHFSIHGVNGTQVAQICCGHNRNCGELDGILTVLREIAELAPGSYGLLHVEDGDDPLNGQIHHCYVLRKGTLLKETDPFLTPLLEKVG